METCNECEYHIRAGVKDTAFFYHVCTYKQIRGIGKSRIICGKGEEPCVPDWCPLEDEKNE